MLNKNLTLSIFFTLSIVFNVVQKSNAQTTPYVSEVWVSDQGNGTYKNPILNADYSDPDVVRVGDDYYMTASSFDAVPGLPILHSKDLVNWSLINHALRRQFPIEHFEKTQHGNGVWAPSIRYHNNEFYIFYGDPDFGIYMVKSKDPRGVWDDPILLESAKGIIDVSPLWDDDGQTYIAYAYAGSRAGIKSVIAIKKVDLEANKTLDEGVIVFDGHETDPTIEGPKIHKHNGYYYIFAPGGGVSTGWQTVLRSKNVYGPYERKMVMHQGKTDINGPHQGAWVDTPTGEDWFIHFQDRYAYGRVVHLQPMVWKDGWPIIGNDSDNDGIGEPVSVHKKPNVGKTYPIVTPVESDEFEGVKLGKQWQWQANPQATWSFLYPEKGVLRLYTQQIPAEAKNLWDVPNILLQKFPATEFTATTKVTFSPNERLENEETGLVIMAQDYANLSLKSKKDGIYLVHGVSKGAINGNPEVETVISKLNTNTVYLRVKVIADAKYQFSYSLDGKKFTNVGDQYVGTEGKWIGAKVGLFSTRETTINDAGWGDYDWFRITK
jgi:beta-xylosidase